METESWKEAFGDNGDADINGPERFQIRSPSKNDMADIVDELDDGPTMTSDRGMRTPVRAPPTKRRSSIHNDVLGTKKI